jgi:hypothetical protein
MKRREFLKRSALAAAGAAATASGMTAVVGFTADEAGPKLTALDQHQAETLLKMARQIFPHDHLDDAVYEGVVQALDEEAAKTPATAKLLRDGIAKLDDAQRDKFITLSPDKQVAALKKIEDTPFFQKVRSVELVALYNNHAVWKQLGYPGASYQIGGYIHHGFDDLGWLPNPPESASPKPA